MNLRIQMIRATAALAVLGGIAVAETTAPVVDSDCPLVRMSRPQRILLIDPVHKHPVWIDARVETPTPKRRA